MATMALFLPRRGSSRASLLPPVGMGTAGGVRRFHHRGADVAPAGLGDPSTAVSLAAVVHPRPQASVADQVLGRGEARDVTDGSQQGEGGEQAMPGICTSSGTRSSWAARICHRIFQMGDLGLGEDQESRSHWTRARSSAETSRPSHHSCFADGEGIAFWWQQMMAMQDGVQAVLGLGGQAHHLASLGDQGAMHRAPPGAAPRREAAGRRRASLARIRAAILSVITWARVMRATWGGWTIVTE